MLDNYLLEDNYGQKNLLVIKETLKEDNCFVEESPLRRQDRNRIPREKLNEEVRVKHRKCSVRFKPHSQEKQATNQQGPLDQIIPQEPALAPLWGSSTSLLLSCLLYLLAVF
jgi:hypothetical protein